ncbi:ribonuclease R [Allofrancisella guangzhouensis]|uniref:Ribonuclease R n=1 Tax=Allofrancisella guangzhouensis TaxID=594679 RepID=A0A0A8E6Z0_9GAMM|nr:ribonuclease R [Allofrancisella guangzhouensis]AJC49367.1 ribonuclease R [Allofrancisella guangzhouensis]MBK2026992.1 ribonuclease R [Allofrancisella guangzhouensis]MBK2043900.1 ribonuclease R [Allofrancisella guangzhouensis]MBK2044987.1 ribonuclease R [Allofrancisella guangzhouensis]
MSKYSINNDPNKDLEAQKYENPIASREMILQYIKDTQLPVSADNVALALEINKKSLFEGLVNRLGAMVRDGQLVKDRSYYSLPDMKDIYVTSKITVDRDGRLEIFSHALNTKVSVLSSQAKMLMMGDEITAKVLGVNKKGKIEAEIKSVVSRAQKFITGYYYKSFDGHFLRPISKNISGDIVLLPPRQKIEQDSLIEAEIIVQPSINSAAVAKFKQEVEAISPVKQAMMVATKKFDLVEQWSKKTLAYLDTLSDDVVIKGRVDLRKFNFVTIDGEDAKDFDDAVFASKTKTGGWKLFVAIADVSNYVQKDSALDLDAKRRSTSVYFPGFVIPMLPEKLSNGLCSLQPNVDRYSLVCEMNISSIGKLTRYKFYSAVINSKARLTYTEVAKMLDKKQNSILENTPELVPDIFALYDLYKVLHIARDQRGAIDFDTIETQIILDEHNHIQSIIPRQRNDAHRLIEECMLVANVAAAKFVIKNKKTSPFRVHSEPKEDKMDTLKKYLSRHGIHLSYGKDGKVTPKALAQMLESIKSRPDYEDIQMMTLRSMNQAVYSIDNVGHFGLAYDEYTHFTSPIRRYPDLVVHRIIKSIINEYNHGGCDYKSSELANICDNASFQERNADGASKQVEDWLKCYFMQDYIGHILEAKITHINGLGLFVELKDMFIEGLVHVSTIPGDYYIFDESKDILIGRRNHKVFKIGQDVTIRVIRADLESIHIDFELYTPDQSAKDYDNPKKHGKKKKKPKKRKQKPYKRKNKTKQPQ